MQFVAYSAASGMAFVVDAAVLMMLVIGWGLPPGIGAAVGFMAGLVLNFVLCRRVVFPQARHTGWSVQLGWFALSGLGGLIATAALVEVLVVHLRWPVLAAKLAAAGVVVVLNFYFRSTFVFKRG